MTFAVEGDHRIVSTDKTDSQRTAAQYVAYLFVRIQCGSAFPYVIAHHERELAGQSSTLILIPFVKLVGYKSGHIVHRFHEDLFRFLLDSILVAFVLYQIFRFDAGFDGKTRHIQRSE